MRRNAATVSGGEPMALAARLMRRLSPQPAGRAPRGTIDPMRRTVIHTSPHCQTLRDDLRRSPAFRSRTVESVAEDRVVGAVARERIRESVRRLGRIVGDDV